MTKGHKLNAREELFWREYTVDGNGAQSAIRAGYAPGCAKVTASKLLKKPEIAFRVARFQAKMREKLEVSSERVVAELAAIAFANMQDLTTVDASGRPILQLHSITRREWSAISEITEDRTGGAGDGKRGLVTRTKVKLSDKLQALELLGKHLKLFTDKIQWMGDESFVKLLEAARCRVKKP